MSRSLATIVMIAAAGLASTACTRFKNTQGYIVDAALVDGIQPGVDNKASVSRTLGRPTASTQWDDRTWYYVQRKTEQLAFMTPEATDQLILKVSFDPAGNVTAVEKRGLEQVASIDPASEETPTLGREESWIQDLFGNIGTVGAPTGGAGGPSGGPNSPN